ncbi:homoserine kinase [Flavobacterium cyanobacteriorum]|uniref:Homoserine kinase n=1 Tax=Flavobacterium cyanobacteriorum TaxID=2022802 RepID=A0A255YTE2_9FLAO|nr:homoserine kinase [Flavobacterium cyanobacteriorum]OYQ31934.1 homoserine kinase [Flavobacterium cyanobacteriorum]
MEVKIFCPATVANVSCGFDVLGLCLDTAGDEMLVERTMQPGVRIKEITGANLPLDTAQNVAGVAATALVEKLHPPYGFDITIHKKIKAGSGLGSSAASAAGAVFAVNHLVGNPLTPKELVHYAMQGEKLASGAAHADNVAPALLGGFTLVRSYEPLDIIEIPAPENLYVAIIHPHIEVRTKDARAVLKDRIDFKKAVIQTANLAGLISGLYTADFDLIGRSLHDVLVEPLRAHLIPHFSFIKKAALDAGALGAGISGSGPSVFALAKGNEAAGKAAGAMAQVLEGTGIDYEIHVSNINPVGIKIV